jgi:hypothetical protein
MGVMSDDGRETGDESLTAGEERDPMLEYLAADYNRPPATPRDDMWSAIMQARGASTTVAPIATRAPWARRLWPVAAAAVLLLAAGMGLGMWIASGRGASQQVAQTQKDSAGAAPRVADPSSRDTTDSAAPGRSGTEGRIPQTLAKRDPGSRDDSGMSGPLDGPNVAGAETSYRLATVQHLTHVEALLTSYRAMSAQDQAKFDGELASWARDLLADTRLLLDSPASQDPLRRKLLEDLELVLAQMAQLAPERAGRGRELIEGTLSREHVLTRLRTAIPAGATSGT